MEFLKEVLGEELYSQVSEKLNGSKIKLADLSGGEYVSIQKFKTLESERDSIGQRLADADKQIEAFKNMDIDNIKKSAEDYKLAAKKAQEEAEAKISAMQFDYALEKALMTASVKDPRIIAPLLKRDMLKLSDEGIVGLKEQLEPLMQSHEYLFNTKKTEEQTASSIPSGAKIVQPDASKPAITDPNLAAFARGAGVDPAKLK